MGEERVHVAGHIRRVRRWADLSQRDLAAGLGVSPAAVGRWETGGPMSVAMFEQILAVAGLRIMIVEDDGPESRPTRPMRQDSVRDGGGRRYPAHLDVLPSSPGDERWDRPRRDVYAPRRTARDRKRLELREIQSDHPTAVDVQFEKQVRFELKHMVRMERLERQREYERAHGLTRPEPEPCCCPIECEETRYCGEHCECQCEPPLDRWWSDPDQSVPGGEGEVPGLWPAMTGDPGLRSGFS